MADARVIEAGLQLLDRQLVDPHDRLCGKVDDLELEEGDDGVLHVSAILCGPGALLRRTGFERLGGWLRRFVQSTFVGGDGDPGRIPFEHVKEIASEVRITLDQEDLATFAGERWVRDHVIARIPGSEIDAPG